MLRHVLFLGDSGTGTWGAAVTIELVVDDSTGKTGASKPNALFEVSRIFGLVGLRFFGLVGLRFFGLVGLWFFGLCGLIGLLGL